MMDYLQRKHPSAWSTNWPDTTRFRWSTFEWTSQVLSSIIIYCKMQTYFKATLQIKLEILESVIFYGWSVWITMVISGYLDCITQVLLTRSLLLWSWNLERGSKSTSPQGPPSKKPTMRPRQLLWKKLDFNTRHPNPKLPRFVSDIPNQGFFSAFGV